MARSIPPKPRLTYMITKARWGGAQKYVYQLATSPIIRSRFDVSVVAGEDGELLDRLRSKGVQVFTVRQKNTLNPLSSMVELWRITRFLEKIRPTIIHVNSSKMSFLGTIAAKITNVPHIVFTSHGWPFHEQQRLLFIRLGLRAVFLLTSALSSRVIAVSNHIKESIKAPSFIRKKIVVIYNGIEKQDIPQLPKLSLGSTTKHIVSVGELNLNKGQDTVLHVLPYVEGVHYHVIGDGDMKQKLERMVEKKKLGNKVTLYGHITHAGQLLSQYDVLLVPSRTESLGYIVLEGLLAGLPVIAHNVGGMPEILKGLPSARLYNENHELVELLRADIPPTVNWNDSRFDIETMIKKTMVEYERLLEKSSFES